MPSTATPIAKLEDQATGENAATWGTKTDNNLELIEQMAKSVYPYSCAASGDITLDDTQFVANDTRRAMIRLTGSRSAAGNVVVPTRQGWWFFENLTTGGHAMTIKTSAGTGVSLPASGGVYALICDGTNVENMELVNDTLLQAELGAISAGGFYTSSSTSNAIAVAGTNQSYVTAESGKAFTPGTPLRIARTSDPANYYMDAITTAYSGTALDITVTDAVGSGTFSAWSISVAGGPSITSSTIVRRAVTTNDTVELTDNGGLIDCTSGSFTLTLPAAATAGNGFNVRVLNSGSGTVVVDGDGSETINGSANKSLAQYQCVHLFCNGTGWVILSPSKIVAAELGSGSASSSTFLRGDLSWANAGTTIETISANDTLAAADSGTCKRVTATCTLSLTAAATLGSGWWCDVIVDGDYNDLRVVTVDPNSTEEIDEQTTIKAYVGEQFRIYCDGTKFRTYGRQAEVFFGEASVGTSTTYDFFTDGAFLDDPEIQGFRIVVDGASHDSGSSRNLYLRFANGSGVVDTGSNYNNQYIKDAATASYNGVSASETSIPLGGSISASGRFHGVVRGARLPLGSIAALDWSGIDGSGEPWFGHTTYSGTIGGFQLLLVSSGNFDAGVVRVWGTRARMA